MNRKILWFISFSMSLLMTVSCKPTQTTVNNSDSVNQAHGMVDNSNLFIEATKERILGKIEESKKLYEKCLEINPLDAASMFELAKIHTARKEYEMADRYLAEACRIEPDNAYYLQFYASLLQALEQYEKAVGYYESLVRLKPNNLEYFDKLAIAYLYAGKPDKAIKVYDDLESRIGIEEDISMKKHSIYLQENQIEKAANEINKLIATFPDNSKYYSILAEMYMSEGMNQKALENYMKVKEIDPDNPFIDISLADYYKKNGESEIAYEYLKLGFANQNLDIDTKIQILIRYYTINEIYSDLKYQAFELSKILIATHPEDPKAYSMYGDFLYQDKQYELASNTFRKVIELDNSKYLVWEQLMFTEAELYNNDSLLVVSQQAMDLFPEQPLPYLFAGSVYYQKKMWEECVNILEQGLFYVVRNDAMLTQFYSYLGDAYNQLKEIVKSDESYEKALKIDPNNDYVLNNYAYYLSLRGENLEKAAQMAKRATELKPGSSNSDTYGWVLYKQGKYSEALEWLLRAIDLGGENNPVILEHLGDVLWQLGRSNEAVDYWMKAKEAGEGSDYLEKKVTDKMLYE